MRKRKVFKWFFKIHIYGGLYSSLFFLIVGITALDFQHHILNRKDRKVEEYSQTIHFDEDLQRDSLCLQIRDSLGIFGHVPHWRTSEDSVGNLSFLVHRPGRRYEISANRENKSVSIKEVSLGFGSVLLAFHLTVGGAFNRPIFTLWSFYGQTATVIGFILAITSVYFWYRKSVKRKYEWFIIYGAGILTIVLILSVWLVG